MIASMGVDRYQGLLAQRPSNSQRNLKMFLHVVAKRVTRVSPFHYDDPRRKQRAIVTRVGSITRRENPGDQ